MGAAPGAPAPARARRAGDLGVTVEAQFTVGEYQIVILSAKESTGLDTWLRRENYNIPEGAEPLLRPYVESGSKFFVAKVDPRKVKFVDGRADLSPLRFHYDSDQFVLPIRLGLANSGGTQDLIVSILAPNQRYEVANYKNVTIPTNLDVKDAVRDRFGAFYAALFDRTLERNPGAVVTEYAWQAATLRSVPGADAQRERLHDARRRRARARPADRRAGEPCRAGGQPRGTDETSHADGLGHGLRADAAACPLRQGSQG